MSLADLANRDHDGPGWRTCSVCHALDTMPPKDAELLRGLLSDSNVRYSHISEAARDDGLDLDTLALSRHARGICKARVKLR